MPKEQNLVDNIKKWAKFNGWVFYKNPPTKKGRLDIELHRNAFCVFIETKKEGAGKNRFFQASEMKKLIEHGCIAKIVESFQEFLDFMQEFKEI